MDWHPFRLDTVTPTFLGAADVAHDRPVPFPVASLRGVLRYWLRALAGAHVGEDLRALAASEAKVFGRAARDTGDDGTGGTADDGPRSPVLLRAGLVHPDRTARPDWLGNEGGHVPYLLGQGLCRWIDKRPVLARGGHLPAGTPVRLRVAVRAEAPEPVGDLFLAALWALTRYGGLGARSRRCFGTVRAVLPTNLPRARFDPDWFTAPADASPLPAVLDAVGGALADLLPGGWQDTAPDRRPSYPCFRPKWFLERGEVATSPSGADATSAAEALDYASDVLREFRLGVGRTSPGGTTLDYQTLIRPYLLGDALPDEPFRSAAIGLPVGFSSRTSAPGGRATVTPTATDRDGRVLTVDRRASPLWLRVHQDGECWRLTSMGFFAELLPPNAALRIKGGTGEHRRDAETVHTSSDTEVDRILNSWFTAD